VEEREEEIEAFAVTASLLVSQNVSSMDCENHEVVHPVIPEPGVCSELTVSLLLKGTAESELDQGANKE
jgi:hypothetical protein